MVACFPARANDRPLRRCGLGSELQPKAWQTRGLFATGPVCMREVQHRPAMRAECGRAIDHSQQLRARSLSLSSTPHAPFPAQLYRMAQERKRVLPSCLPFRKRDITFRGQAAWCATAHLAVPPGSGITSVPSAKAALFLCPGFSPPSPTDPCKEACHDWPARRHGSR